MPNKNERKEHKIRLDLRFKPQCIPSSFQPYFRFLIILQNLDEIYSYEFERRNDWVLTSIENQSLRKGKIIVKDWLNRLFPKIEDCSPIAGLNFETATGQTSTRLLEDLGYQPAHLNRSPIAAAIFKINEEFYGLPASELWIDLYHPEGGVECCSGSSYRVVIPVNASTVQKKLHLATGFLPGIEMHSGEKIRNTKLPAGGVDLSGVGYLVDKGNNTTEFVCHVDGY